MTVIGQIPVESRRYSGWLDPRYPIGYWQAALSVTGDLSGGFVGIDLLFQTANGPTRLNSELFSCERFAIGTTHPGALFAAVQAVNMGGPANQGFQQRYNVELTPVSGITITAIPARELVILPWFLGSQRTAGLVTSLTALIENDDGIVYTFEAEGYRWSARSVLVDGGPQRPPNGPYRS